MNDQGSFLLRLAEADAPVRWRLRGETGEGQLSEAALRAGETRARVLVPGAEVLSARVNLPGKQRSRLLRALPYAMEEQLAAEVDSQHFALGEAADAEDHWPVAVVASSRMEEWHTRLGEASLEASALLPDYLALPLNEGRWSLLLEADGALLRSGATQGWRLPLADLPALLALALREAEGVALDLYRAPGVDAPPLNDIEVTDHGEVEPLELFARGLAAAPAINLLQGKYSRSERLGKLWRPWRAAAAMAAIWLLLQGGLAIHELSRLESEQQRLQAEIEQLFTQAMPGRRLVIGQERRLMEAVLDELRGGGGAGFARLLAVAGPLLQRQQGLELRALRYKQGAMELDLKLNDLPSLDKLKAALGAAGLQVETISATSSGSRVESRIAIRGGGA